MSKDIIYNESARAKMRAGIEKVAKAVKVTLGPRGRNVVIRKPWGGPDVTKDGVTVAKEIVLKDQAEDLGAQLCKQVASRTNDVVGDGTTTATVLAESMVAEGSKFVANGSNPVLLKKGIDLAVQKAIEALEKEKKVINLDSYEDIKHIATISGNDAEVGKVVADAYVGAGENGIVTFEEGKSIETSVDLLEGFHFDRGYMSPYFITDPNKMQCEYEDCFILFWDKTISNPTEIVPLLNTLASQNAPLLIIANDIDTEALSLLVYNKFRGNIRVVAVKGPGFGERKANLMGDMALLTGGTYFSESFGKKLENVSIAECGVAKKVIVTQNSTTIIGGNGDKEKVDEQIRKLKEQVATVESEYDREKLIERVAKLSGAVAVIRIGATVESELKEKKYRYEDSVSATKAALEQGILPGGGTALYRARKALKKLKIDNSDVLFGTQIVLKALEVPVETILENSGFSSDVKNKIFNAIAKGQGYDGVDGAVVKDMYKYGIVDPFKVVIAALESAAAVAGVFLTSEAVIIDTPTETKENNN